MIELRESLILELHNRIGTEICVFLKNNFRYRGELKKVLEDGFILVADKRSGKDKLISIGQISEVDFDG